MTASRWSSSSPTAAPTVGETKEKVIIEATRDGNTSKARLFVFGVGYDVNVTLLDTLAEDGRGARDYVTPGRNMELVLSSFFDKIAFRSSRTSRSRPTASSCTRSIRAGSPTCSRAPSSPSSARYKGSGARAIRLAGKVDGKRKELVFEGTFADGKTGKDFLAVLWAKRKVGYLWDQIRLKGENRELKDEIVRLGKTYGIATPYTSFLVTEDERREAARRDRRAPPAPGDRGRWGADRGELQGEGADDAVGRFARPATGSRRKAGHESGSREEAVERSLAAKRLREDDSLADAPGGEEGERARAPPRRTHLSPRGPIWLESGLEDKALKDPALVTVEPWSKEWFALVRGPRRSGRDPRGAGRRRRQAGGSSLSFPGGGEGGSVC